MRQETSRRKAPAARILSLALALAMVLAFVPAMSIGVSADDETETAFAQGKAWFAFEFTLNTISDYKDLGFTDADSNMFAGVCNAWKYKDSSTATTSADTLYPDGFYVADGERSYKSGDEYVLGSDFVRTTSGPTGIGSIEYDGGVGTRVRVLVVKDTSAYTITYSTVVDSVATSFATVEYSSASGGPNGISIPSKWNYDGGGGGVTADNAEYAFADFTVYAGDDTSSIVCDDTTLVYETDVTNPDVSDYYKGKIVTFDDDETQYKIVSNNLIPNGDFSYDLAGWMDGINHPQTTATVNGDGTIKMSSSSCNTNNKYNLYRAFAVESGKTYLYTYTASTSSVWHKTSFTNTLGASSVNETKVLVGSGSSPSVTDSTSNAFKLENTDYSYLRLLFRWSESHTFGNFGLYEIEEYVATETSATVYLKDGDENIIQTIPVTGLFADNSYTYTADSYITSENYAAYYTLADGQNLTIGTLSENADENELTVYYDKVNFKAVEVPDNDERLIVDNSLYKVTDNTNKVTNPSFETAAGDFSMYGWHSASTGGVFGETGTGHSYKVNSTGYSYISGGTETAFDTAIEIPDGEWAFGSRWNDGSNGLCSIRDNFYVGEGTYYLSFYTKATTTDKAILEVGATSSLTAGNIDDSDATLYMYYGSDEYPDWTKIETIVTTTEENPYVQFTAYWLGNGGTGAGPYFYYDDFVLIEVEDLTPTVNYVDSDGNALATARAKVTDETVESYTFPVRTFYSEEYSALYTTKEETLNVGDTKNSEVTLEEGKIVPTRDGFITPNCSDDDNDVLDSAEYYINSNNDNSIFVSGVTTSDPFDVFQYITDASQNGDEELTKDTTGETAKTRLGYLEFDVPAGLAKTDEITLTLKSYKSYGVKDSQIAAIATTLDVSGFANGNTTAAGSFDLELINPESEVYLSNVLTGEEGETVTIDLTGVEAVDSKVKVILIIPKGYIWFANEEKTVFGGDYEGDTAYAVITDCSEPVNAEITLVDSDGNEVDTYTVENIPYTTSSITVPAGIYGGQYYLDAAETVTELTQVTGEDGTTVTGITGELAIDELELFTWRASYNSAVKTNETYNAGIVVSWNGSVANNQDRVGYAYVKIPEYDADTQYLKMTVEAVYNNGYNNSDVPVAMFEAVDYNTLKAIDLTSGETATAQLAALETTELAEVDMYSSLEGSTYTYTTKEPQNRTAGKVVANIYDSDALAALASDSYAAIKMYDTDGGIAVITNIEFEAVEKDLGIDLIDGAQIRIGGGFNESEQDLLSDSGLRFIAVVDTGNKLAGVADDLVLEDGTTITKGNMGIAIFNGGFSTDKFDVLTANIDKDAGTLDGYGAVAKIPAAKYQSNASSVFTAAITNIADTNFNRIYVAVPYVVVNGETHYDWDEAVARTPYEVAKGLLCDNTTISGYTTEESDALISVLNVYTNKTGARITLDTDDSSAYTVATVKYANGAEAFFEVSGEYDTETGDYVITFTTDDTTGAVFYDYATAKYRVNNQRDKFVSQFTVGEETVAIELVDKNTMTITIPAEAMTSTDSGETDSGEVEETVTESE